MDAEDAYRRACVHWLGCSRCSRAGGEWAALWDLCPVGRELTRVWARAEARGFGQVLVPGLRPREESGSCASS